MYGGVLNRALARAEAQLMPTGGLTSHRPLALIVLGTAVAVRLGEALSRATIRARPAPRYPRWFCSSPRRASPDSIGYVHRMVSRPHGRRAQEGRADHGPNRCGGGAAGRANSWRERESADRAAAPRPAAPLPEDPEQGRPGRPGRDRRLAAPLRQREAGASGGALLQASRRRGESATPRRGPRSAPR